MSDDYVFQAYITNLGKYNEGELVGEWVNFPSTPEEIQKVFERIGIGELYEEWFITDYDCPLAGLYDIFGEYESLDELNYLANKIEEMMANEQECFQAAIELGEYTGSVKDVINLTENLDCYTLYSDIHNDYDLGYYWIEESGVYDTKALGNLSNYIDYEAFGRDIGFEECGTFTDFGYVVNNQDRFIEQYNGDREEIPDEYRVTVTVEEQEFYESQPVVSDDELQESTDLAFDLDEFFRAHNKEYAKKFPEAHAKKEDLADCLLDGNTIEIKKQLDDMGQDSGDVLNIRLADYENEFDRPGKNLIHIQSACNSNYKGMIAFVGDDDKVYLGKSENYLFHSEHIPYYDNTDNSFIHISDNKEMYYYLYGEGWNSSQAEMLKKGYCKESDYAEFAALQKDVLSQFEKKRDFAFAGKPFNYLETAEKSAEQNYNQIDGQINNESEVDKMNDKITVLVVEPMKEPYVKDIESGLKSLQNEVDGNIEAYYPFEDMVGIVCNEEGKINGLELNRAIYDDDNNMIEIMAGTFLVVGLADDSFGSLDADMIKKYSDMFKYPEQFFKLGNEIVAAPVKPSIKQLLHHAQKEQGVQKPPQKKPPENEL